MGTRCTSRSRMMVCGCLAQPRRPAIACRSNPAAVVVGRSNRRLLVVPSANRARYGVPGRGGMLQWQGRTGDCGRLLLLRRSLATFTPGPDKQEDLSPTRTGELSGQDLRQVSALLMREGSSALFGDGSPVHSAAELAMGLGSSMTDGAPDDEEDLQRRRNKWGSNVLPKAPRLTFLQLAWDALQDVTLYALIASGLFSVLTGKFLGGAAAQSGTLEGIAILGSVAVVVLVTAVNDYQKESQFQELNTVKDDLKVRVLRSGSERVISATALVVGDLMLVEGGDILPVDVVLVNGSTLKVDESHLTGEADEVLKDTLGDPLVVSGSQVSEGSARGLVIAVGANSQSGMISMLTSGAKLEGQEGAAKEGEAPEAPAGAAGGGGASPAPSAETGMRQTTVLSEKLDAMAEDIGRWGLVAAAATTLLMSAAFSWETFVAGGAAWSWEFLSDYLEFFISGITVLVVAVPEGLPLAVTIALAFSVKQMLAEKNLVRQLDACETMGCATTILTDKTGTLTQNKMTAVRLWAAGSVRIIPDQSSAIYSSQDLYARGLATFTFTEDLTSDCSSDLRAFDDDEDEDDEGEWNLMKLPLDLRRALCNGIARNTTASPVSPPPCGASSGIGAAASGASGAASSGASGPTQWSGSRTEGALLGVAYAAGCDVISTRLSCETRCILPFSSKRKCMGSIALDTESHGTSGTLHVKGAPDMLLERCSSMMMEDGSVVPLSEELRESLKAPFGDDGLRVLCIADKYLEEVPPSDLNCGCVMTEDAEDEMLSGLTLVALVGIEDPVRPEVHGAVAQCQRAGITVRMLTGDNAATGASIARQAGILQAADEAGISIGSSSSNGTSTESSGGGGGSGGAVWRAQDFMDAVTGADGAPDAQRFRELWPQVRVLARCSPVHKHEIIKKLQVSQGSDDTSGKQRREVLAMTGDGTNDAPALRAANVGFGMNSGTSIAKSASDIVIMDDSFASLVSAVRWGRNVYVSITKFLQFQLTINVVAVGITVLGAAVLNKAPLGAVQMLWVNLIMDSLASLALATEPPTDAMLEMPPFSSDAPLLTDKVLKHIAGQAVYQLAVLIGLLSFSQPLLGLNMQDALQETELFTVVFNSLVMMSLFNQVNCRRVQDERNVLDNIGGNRFFLYIIIGEALLQYLIVQYGGDLFKTAALDFGQWGLCIALGAGSMAVHQVLVRLPDPSGWAESVDDAPPTTTQ